MRRLFANVPVIYGFSSLAPYGRVAGPLLTRYFDSGVAAEIGSGQPSERLLKLFGPTNMTVATGMSDSEANADFRAEVCRFYDDRLSPAQKLAFIHATVGGEMAGARMSFDRIEKFFASLTDEERRDDAFVRAFATMARDNAARERYVALARDTEDPALRVRMIALARTVGWLSPHEQRAELVRMILDVIAGSSLGYGEVDLICTLNKDGELDPELAQFKVSSLPARKTAQAAAHACLGSAAGRPGDQAIASPDEQDVQIAQAYLRHWPMTEASELRAVALGIARMPGSQAQVRALDTLARHHISDRQVLDELVRLYARATSVSVQRAIAEIFIRSDLRAIAAPELAEQLRQHRLRSPEGEDLIDVLIRRLEAA